MRTLDSPDAFGWTIFCDDIRQELGGKLSLIGSYSETMYVHGDFPFLLSKFAMLVTSMQQHSALVPIKGFGVFLPGDEGEPSIFSTEGIEPMRKAMEEARDNPKKDAMFAARATIILSPFIIDRPGWLRVRTVRDDDTVIKCGSIHIDRHPAEPTTAPDGQTQS
jgi:hypothetical protein